MMTVASRSSLNHNSDFVVVAVVDVVVVAYSYHTEHVHKSVPLHTVSYYM